MSTPVKILLAATGIGLVVWFAKKRFQSYADQFTVKVSAFGKPGISSGVLSLPIALDINNPTPVAIPIQNVDVTLFVNRNGQLIPVGKTQPTGPMLLPPGISSQTFLPGIDLKAVLTSIDIFNAAFAADINITLPGGAVVNKRFDQSLKLAA